jgi:PAS domain S-box-containing protein
MTKPDDAESGPQAGKLRQEAEQRLGCGNASPSDGMDLVDARALVHELQVHQVELEMQNEELQRVQAELREASDKYHDLFDFAPVGYFLWDNGGRNLEVNLAGAALLGLDRNAACRMRFGQFVAPEDRTVFADFLKRVLLTDAKQTCEVRLARSSAWIFILIEGIATQVRAGALRLCRATVIDLTPQKRADELAATNRAMEAEITARKQAEEALQHAKIAAEAANEAKGWFLANISHELRTPMNAILGMVDLAIPRQVDPAAKDLLETARESADLLLALLSDLLDSAKIESRRLELELAPFSLHHVLRQVAQVLTVRASEKGIIFSCPIPPDLPDYLLGDPMRLRQVLLNLAGNAVKFSDRGQVTVRIAVESRSADAVSLNFAVQDTGIGIPRSQWQRIFDPFAQADASTTRRFGGTGLGLSISSSLVRLMGGHIAIESEPGRGTTFSFTIRLPLASEVLPVPESAHSIATVAASSLRVLLVEDNPANQKLATYILQQRGHTVAVAADGQQGFQMSRETPYDVILMDVQMPGMDGLEATKAIRAWENGQKHVPIIAMTAHAMKSDRQRCLAAGMDAYLSKPVNAQKLIVLVESLALGVPAPAKVAPATVQPDATSQGDSTVVFDPKLALARCFDSREMVRETATCFLNEVDDLCRDMRAALKKGDLVEVGQLGHRLKSTAVYLGARPARDAALPVERFVLHHAEPAEAERAVNALEQECQALKAALANHPNWRL